MLFSNLQQIIRIGDELRDLRIEKVISLPRICVVGSQSSGKSSLLEAIVGLDFLPRGSDVVTRMPLELRLIRIKRSTGQDEPKPFALFGKNKDRIDDMTSIKNRILKEQDDKAPGKSIIDDPILLEIHSPDVPDLSLVDLPGITRNAIAGQVQNIEEVTKEMSNKYIKDPRTIIIPVCAGNQDLSTSDGLSLAKKVDPKGHRTLGVITKVDIMDRGTSGAKLLEQPTIKLRHGYVAVKNRSQDDINNHVSVKTAIEEEKNWFDSKTEYKGVLDLCGSKVLAEKLSTLLYESILTHLPNIRKEIKYQIEKTGKELIALGEPFPKDESYKVFYMHNLIEELSRGVDNFSKGLAQIEETNFKMLSEFRVFVGSFNQSKKKLFKEAFITANKIEAVIDIIDHKGMGLPGFLPNEVFDNRIKREIDKLNEYVETFVEQVRHSVSLALQYGCKQMTTRHVNAREFLESIAYTYLNMALTHTKNLIQELLESEKDMIWTADPMMLSSEEDKNHNLQPLSMNGANKTEKREIDNNISKKLLNMDEFKEDISNMSKAYKFRYERLEKGGVKINEMLTQGELKLYFEKLERYFSIIDRNLSDVIPKIVASNMIIKFPERLKKYLGQQLQERLDDIKKMCPDHAAENRREYLSDLKRRLEKSKQSLDELDYSITVRATNFETKNEVDDDEESEIKIEKKEEDL